MDAAIIAAAQAVEHYEITRYGALIAWSREMGRADTVRILERTLNDEKAADAKLAALAEARVNPAAEGTRAPARLRSTRSARAAASRRPAARAKRSKPAKRRAPRRSR